MGEKRAEHDASNATGPDPKQEWITVVCVSEGDERQNQISDSASDADSKAAESDPDVTNEQRNRSGVEQNKTDNV
jgi:hypothetical protein